jgi:GTPase SAR1 family protein
MREAYCQDIVPTVAQALRDIAELLESKALLLPYSKFDARAANLRARAEWLESGCLRLVVVGMVSRGKSTLINALLGEERLVVDDQSSTGVISEIVYGKNTEEVTIVKKNGEKCAVPNDDFKEKYSLSEKEITSIQDSEHNKLPNRLMSIKQAVLEADYPLGRADGGLRIVDTLGLRAGEDAEGITEEFLDQADAVVVVIDNRGMLEGDDEKEFIKARLRLDDKRLEHIFFVINYFHSKPDWSEEQVEADMDKKKEEARGLLRDYYEQTDGELDRELFDRRVFVVNAYLALNAKVNEGGGAQLERLLAFERAIEQVMSEEERVHLVLEATLANFAAPVLAEARLSIETRRSYYRMTLEELETTQRTVETQLTQLSERALNIQTTFDRSAQQVGVRAANHFESYASRMLDEWPNADERSEIMSVYNRWNKRAGFFGFGASRAELEDGLGKAINRQWQRRMEPWLSEFHQYFEPHLYEIETVLKSKVEDFEATLRDVQKSTVDAPESLLLDQGLKKKVNRILSDAFSQDPGRVGELMQREGFFSKHYLIMAQFVDWPFLFFFADFGFIRTMIRFLKGFAFSQLFGKIHHELRQKFADSLSTTLSNIRTSMSDAWRLPADKLLTHLEAEIDQVKSELDDALHTKRAGEADVAAKMSRLNTIETCLTQSFEQMSQAVYGRVLAPEELQRLIEDEDEGVK